MPRYKGAHLTWNDRLTIEKMLREGYSKPQIARYLGVHHSTVYDECRRGAAQRSSTRSPGCASSRRAGAMALGSCR